MRNLPAVALVVSALLAGGCAGGGASVVCPDILQNGVSVRVRDSVTGAFIGSGAKLVARTATYADSSEYPPGQPSLDAQPLGAAHQSGVYTLTVSRSGYRNWVLSNVSVTAVTKCEISTTQLDALMQTKLQ